MIDIVIARYNENLDWLQQVKTNHYNIKIYNKGNKLDNLNYTQLENIGREAHTYLYHIINNYNNLTEYTYFLQGNPFDHCNNIINILNNFNTNDFWLCNSIFKCQKSGAPHHYLKFGLDIIYSDVYGNLDEFKEPIEFGPGAQFCVHKDKILKHDKNVYINVLNNLIINHYDAWQLERMWQLFFK